MAMNDKVFKIILFAAALVIPLICGGVISGKDKPFFSKQRVATLREGKGRPSIIDRTFFWQNRQGNLDINAPNISSDLV